MDEFEINPSHKSEKLTIRANCIVIQTILAGNSTDVGGQTLNQADDYHKPAGSGKSRIKV
jgi:hypothetical protein